MVALNSENPSSFDLNLMYVQGSHAFHTSVIFLFFNHCIHNKHSNKLCSPTPGSNLIVPQDILFRRGEWLLIDFNAFEVSKESIRIYIHFVEMVRLSKFVCNYKQKF